MKSEPSFKDLLDEYRKFDSDQKRKVWTSVAGAVLMVGAIVWVFGWPGAVFVAGWLLGYSADQ